jgi:hypothetical protein
MIEPVKTIALILASIIIVPLGLIVLALTKRKPRK